MMELLREFDPWRDPLCTCPPKLSLNPYTGCSHACLYCYITSYIPRGFECRPKKDLLRRLEREVEKLEGRPLISMCNSSDPYPPMERELLLTRGCLERLVGRARVLLVTKSDLVVRDLDLLSRLPCAVSMTLTTLKPELARRLEPGAPSPEERLKALGKLCDAGVPVSVRLDPIIPGLNEAEIQTIVEAAASAGVKHVTSSTFKPRADSWERMGRGFPNLFPYLRELYSKGERRKRSLYLPSEMRRELMERVREACLSLGLTFSTCREGFPELQTSESCDGSHLIK
ncbi:MAG: radical SAM protein [Candidatus Hadarchaeales archaeon]